MERSRGKEKSEKKKHQEAGSEKSLVQLLRNNIYQQPWWWIWQIPYLWDLYTANANKHGTY